MKLWEKLDEVEKIEEKLRVIIKKEEKRYYGILVRIGNDPLLIIENFENNKKPRGRGNFSCNIKHAKAIADAIYKLLEMEE